MRLRVTPAQVWTTLLVLTTCALAIAGATRQDAETLLPRAQWNDATPLGGKGLHLLLGQMGYKPQLVSRPLVGIPAGATAWLILDPFARFSEDEGRSLWRWVQRGGTLIWCTPPSSRASVFGRARPQSAGLEWLRRQMKLSIDLDLDGLAPGTTSPLPVLSPLNPGGAPRYWAGVKNAAASTSSLQLQGDFEDVAGNPVGVQLAMAEAGKGRVFLAPDALLFTNYGLAHQDNAVLVVNLVQAHAASGVVVFDERRHGTSGPGKFQPSVAYYLWRPPYRYAVLQLLFAGLLLWALVGRRLGAPVPLPGPDPVTRASQYARAMGALFHRAGRPRAAAAIIGTQFRRRLTVSLGLPVTEPDGVVAARAAQATGMPAPVIERLLLDAKAPPETEYEILSNAQEMEYVLKRISRSGQPAPAEVEQQP